MSRRTCAAMLAAAIVLPWGGRAASDASVSDWVSAGHARVRLIDAGQEPGGRLAGLEVRLDPGYLTYWRTPGEAGLPPTVDFGGSDNLDRATLRFPAPMRLDEGGVQAFGYRDRVVFPIDVVPADPKRPVGLDAALSFAVCERLCLPASAAVRLALTGAGAGPDAALVRDAQRLVPVPQPLGAQAALAVESVEVSPGRERARVTVRVPAGAAARLFAEAPDPWYFDADGSPGAGTGPTTFELRVVAGAKTPARVPVLLTLATETQAVETAVQLDVSAPTP